MNIVNPAYAGLDNKTVITSSIRKQWTGIENAPETQAISFGTPLGKNLGIGISMVNDKTFIEKQTFLGLDFSYKVKLTEKTDLFLGLKAGGNFYNVNSAGLETYNLQSDPALSSISTFTPNLGIGGILKNGDFYISISIPRMLNSTKAKNQDGLATVATDRPHLYISSGYDIVLKTNFADLILKPSFMYRYVNGAPVSIDINTVLNIEKIIEIGAMYRTDNAYAGILNFIINKRFVLGFAYEMSTRQELARARNTNEFILQYKF